jgi:hypothetical protein
VLWCFGCSGALVLWCTDAQHPRRAEPDRPF